jgi:Xaa-Pro aminopeptidase
MFEVTRANLEATATKLGQQRRFLDLPAAQKRIAEFDSEMAGDGFWNNQDAARKVIDDAGYHDAFIHGCCHFVGLEVHDPGDYEAPLPAGAVITVEPGIYLPQRGFGVRIEDEILITPTGAEVLTKAIPREPEEIERRMQNRRADARPGP